MSELRREGFVVGHDDGGKLHAFDHFCHRVGFSTPRHPLKGHILLPLLDTVGKGFNRDGLIPCGVVGGMDFKKWQRDIP